MYYTTAWTPEQQRQNIANLYLNPNNYSRNLQPSMNVVTKAKSYGYRARQGIHKTGRSNTSRMRGRRASKRSVLNDIAQSICPVVNLEENFTAPQFDVTTGNPGVFAPPIVNGEIGFLLYQWVSPTVDVPASPSPLHWAIGPNLCDPFVGVPIAINAGVGSQLVNWQSSYLMKEQDLLIAAAAQSSGLVSESTVLQYDLGNSQNYVPVKDFAFGGATTYHTFNNPTLHQCYFSLYEIQPRRAGYLTPQECWDYDLQEATSGVLVPVNSGYPNLAGGVPQTYRTAAKAGSVPGNLKRGAFNYWFKIISKKSFHMEPGEELKYKQVYPPWVDRHAFRNMIFQPGGSQAIYNTHSRFLLFLGHGEVTTFKGEQAGLDLDKYAAYPGSWQLTHHQRRLSSYQCLMPTRVSQRQILDVADIFAENDKNASSEFFSNEAVDSNDVAGGNPLV